MYKKILLQIEKEYTALNYGLKIYLTIRRALKNFDPKMMEFIWKMK